MTTRYTLQDGLAYVEKVGTTRGLRQATLSAMKPYLKARGAGVNAQGRALARRSRMWKAVQQLEEAGFHPLPERATPSAVPMENEEHIKAVADRRGRVFVVRKGRETLVGQHVNG